MTLKNLILQSIGNGAESGEVEALENSMKAFPTLDYELELVTKDFNTIDIIKDSVPLVIHVANKIEVSIDC